MIENIEFEKGNYGTRAVIKSMWHKSYIISLLNNNVFELELNNAKGWYGKDVDFLQDLPFLKSFTIIDFNPILETINAVHSLRNLRSLNISTYCKTPINFFSFPYLEKCSLEWREGSESLFEKRELDKLFLNNYNKLDSHVFSHLTNLKELSVLNSPWENLLGLNVLKQLKYLRIGNLKKLASLKGIGELYQLEELHIQQCKRVKKISEILELRKLKYLSFTDMGDIESIRGIENLRSLEILLFYGSTNIVDGDLSQLLKLGNLLKISFQNRKHYSQKREDFGNLYSNTLPPPSWR